MLAQFEGFVTLLINPSLLHRCHVGKMFKFYMGISSPLSLTCWLRAVTSVYSP
jgi:hypothetical protein